LTELAPKVMAFKHKLFIPFKFLFASDLIMPIVIFISYVAFIFILRGVFPSGEELVTAFAELYRKYGYEIIFFSALLESLILVNFLVPGQLGMALGIVFSRTGETQFPLVILFVTFGAFLGYMIDFILGYFGFSKILTRAGYGGLVEESKNQTKKFGKRGLILSFFHITIGSLSSFSAGTIKMNWLLFSIIALFSTLLWTLLWGVIIYALGDIVVDIFKKYAFFLVGLFILGMVAMRFWKAKK